MLLYLTLKEDDPNPKSTKGLEKDKDYFCISYRDHILKWLEECRKEAVNSSFLRETISQYILLIKQLTGQVRSKQMSNEIVKAITKSEENFKAYWDIIELNRQEVIEHVFKDRVLPDLEKIAKAHGLEFSDCSDEFKILAEGYGFIFKKSEWEEIEINFYFFKNLSGLVYFIYNREKNFKEAFQSKRSMEKYRNWDNRDVFAKLYCPGNDVIKEIDNKLAELKKEVEQLL
jgi:hypothetical protein